MIYNYEVWWRNLYGPTNLITEIKKEINNKKNIIINCDIEMPWIDYFFREVLNENFDFRIDDSELIIDSFPDDSTILKEILERNGIGYQYKGDKNSIKYLDDLDSEYIKLYYIRNVPSSRIDELSYLMKNMSSNSKVLIIAISDKFVQPSGSLRVKKYSDYISQYDNIRLLKLVTQSNGYSNFINDYIAELIGRIEPNLEKAVESASEYVLNHTYDTLDENMKKLVWEAQLITFFPLVEKTRSYFVNKHYEKIKNVLPIKDVFGNEYNLPEELEVGHLRRIIKDNNIFVPIDDQQLLEKVYDIRNTLAHQKIVNELSLKNSSMFIQRYFK